MRGRERELIEKGRSSRHRKARETVKAELESKV